MADEFPASEHENAARALIARAGAELGARRADMPASFVAQLYGRVVPEDVLCYAAADLAALAERAFDFLEDRPPGAPKIRCETVTLKDSGARKSISVIEIVNDDMPFLVDSVMSELAERRLAVQLVAHPVFGVQRDGAKLLALGAADAAGNARESFIHIHLEPVADEAARADIVRALAGVLGEVRLAVQDWRAMLERANSIVADLKTNPPPLPVDEIAEAIQFLQWLLADNFTFLGVRNYTFDGNALQADFDNALGIMRSPELRVLKRGNELLEYTPEIMAFLKEPRLLIIAKANIHARVHRRVYLDYIGIKRFDAAGNLVGEQRIVGLFTSTAYTRTAHSIPYLRRKIAGVEQRAGFDANSHSGKALTNVLEHFPRDELFQIDDDSLFHFALAILQLDERPRVRVLARRDRFDRFVSVLVYVPRDRYDSDIRVKIGDYLSRAFIGRVSAFYPFFPEGPLVRVHFIIGRSGGAAPAIDSATLEREVGGNRSLVERRIERCARPGQFARQGARVVRPLPRCVFHRLPGSLCADGGGRRYPRCRIVERRAAAGRRFPSPAGGRAARGRPQSLESGPSAAAVGTRSGSGKHGFPGGGRAHLPHRAEGRRRPRCLVPRHAAGAPRRRHDRPRSRQGAAGSRLPDGDARASRERRLQRADALPAVWPGATWR